MKTYPAVIAALGISALLLTPVAAAPKVDSPSGAATGEARKEIQAIYNREAAAFAAKDAAGFFKGNAPDAVSYDMNGGKQTLTQSRQMVEPIIAAMKKGEAAAIIKSITLTDAHTAVVTVQQHMHIFLTQPGKPDADIKDDSVARETWAKTATGWQMTVSRSVSDQQTVNGKAVRK